MTWLWLWLACAPDDPAPLSEVDDDPTQVGLAVLATLSLDYTAGTLTTVALDGQTVDNDVATVHPDTVVQAEDDAVWVVQRLLADAIRRYDPADLRVPVWEASVGAGTNPHAVARVGDVLVVSRYGDAALALLDAGSGTSLGTVDLAPWADDDGIPEASDLVQLEDGSLWVGLQRLQRLNGWTPAENGWVVRVDVATRAATTAWTTPPNAVLRATATQLVALGTDGMWWIDPSDGRSVVESTTSLGLGDLVDADLAPDGAAVAVFRSGEVHTPACRDADGVWIPGTPLRHYVPDVARGPDGAAWLALRPPWSDPSAGGGVLRLDPTSCEPMPEGADLATQFPPFSIAFVEPKP